MAVGSMQVLLWTGNQIYLNAKILYHGRFEQRCHLLLGTEKQVNSHAVWVRKIEKKTYSA